MTAQNTVTIVGNLTRDPELRFLPSGTALCNLGVAVNRRYQKGNSKDWTEETSFFDCVIWRDQAENVAESVAKGDRVIIVGRLDQRSWETEDGDKRSKVEITVDEIGPSLRWATSSPKRTPKKDGNGEAGSAGGGEGFDYADAEEPF